MERYLPAVAIALLVAMAAMPADAAVIVSFVQKGPGADAPDSQVKPTRSMLELEDYLKRLGDRYLPPQDTLSIEVMDVEFAGGLRDSPYANSEVRSFSGDADWPRIELRYALESKDGISVPVQETVVDMAYLRRLEPKYAAVSLPYEKRMLEQWFKTRFVDHASPR